VKCSECHRVVDNWLRREHKVYCIPCYKTALKLLEGLSTHATEEANLRKGLKELEGQR